MTRMYIDSGEPGLDGGPGGLWKNDDTLALKCYRCYDQNNVKRMLRFVHG